MSCLASSLLSVKKLPDELCLAVMQILEEVFPYLENAGHDELVQTLIAHYIMNIIRCGRCRGERAGYLTGYLPTILEALNEVDLNAMMRSSCLEDLGAMLYYEAEISRPWLQEILKATYLYGEAHIEGQQYWDSFIWTAMVLCLHVDRKECQKLIGLMMHHFPPGVTLDQNNVTVLRKLIAKHPDLMKPHGDKIEECFANQEPVKRWSRVSSKLFETVGRTSSVEDPIVSMGDLD
eukprot:TRINITY_DN3218_c1_g1_i3.p1 TRINITY_DN3218_c1_g1~~TRINITY_DN3218_c1_g1_i3.p1  ORF type:complete len:235 (+),score=39.15 TRINITY_DN3218_c1_g1_i3:175-879(+)